MKNILLKIVIIYFVGILHPAYSSSEVYSGVGCFAANDNQSQYLSRSKNGLKNNSRWNLFVICPININPDDWDATPAIEVSVSTWMPPGYGLLGAAGPFCSIRIMETQFDEGILGSNTSDQFAIHAIKSFHVDNFFPITYSVILDPNVYGDDSYFKTEMDINAFPDFFGNLDKYSAHLLCQLPKNGGMITAYYSKQK